MRITLGPSVVRGNIDESITGLWSFANVLGLLTDVIGELTPAAGVTVDGLEIKDAGIPEAAVTAHEAALAILESQIVDGTILARLAAAEVISGGWRFDASVEMRATLEMLEFASEANAILRSDVVGDTVERFALHVNGIMQWGDGSSARDTNLFRSGADELKTDDNFRAAKNVIVGEHLKLSKRNMTLSGSPTVHDIDTGVGVFQRLDPNGTTAITGFTGGSSGRVIVVSNITGSPCALAHQNAGSVAANRIICPADSTFNISASDGVLLWYDSTTSRWRTVALNP